MKDQGYNSVIKEYDFYNCNDNDFEIIYEYSNNKKDQQNDEKNNINNNDKNNKNNKKIQNFILKIFKIIFKSRNKRNEFSSKSKLKLNDNKKENNLFEVDIEELIEYDNLRILDDSNGDKKKKYIIDFYLVKKESQRDNDSLKSVKFYDKHKILVERWKIKYKENFKFKYDKRNLDMFLDKKLKILENNITTYSRVLPLYNISKDDSYYIDFKFNPIDKKGIKLFVDEKSSKKIKLVNEDIFSFNVTIKYLEIKPENIDIFFNKNNYDFVIIPSNKSRRRFLSDEYYKKSSNQLLKEEDENNNKYYNETTKPDFIINNFNNRKFSLEENKIDNYINFKKNEEPKEYNLNKKELNYKENSSEDDLSLEISENNSDDYPYYEEYKDDNFKNKRKMTYDKNKSKYLEENKPRKYKKEYKKKKNKETKFDIKNLDLNQNLVVKNIVKNYKNIKKMMKIMPYFGNIKYNKLSTFICNS